MALERKTRLKTDPAKTRAWQQKSARKAGKRKTRTPDQRETYLEAQEVVWAEAEGRCMAVGFHHHDCPGHANVPHHILPQEHGGPDTPENLLPVWGGLSKVDGCHGKIHREREEARALGYLRRPPNQEGHTNGT